MSLLTITRKRLFSSFLSPFLSRFVSASAPQNQDPKSLQQFSVNDYLITTFGFSPAKAAAISKSIAHLKSPQNPDAVYSFLTAQGFNHAEIKIIITGCPTILCSSPQNTISPNLTALRGLGLSTSALTHIILSAPQALQLTSAVPRIHYWRDFVGCKEAALVKLFKRNRGLIGLDINGGITTKISLLQSHGISNQDIQWIICTVVSFITRSVSTMEDLLKRAKELGLRPESKMFAHGLLAMRSANREAVQQKMELLKSIGWSQDEILSAIKKTPIIVALSEENLQSKMNFLLEEAKCDISYIAFNPVLLTLSLEKRLRPRRIVLQLLESKGLHGKRKDFCYAMSMSNSVFVAKYILPYEEELPELHDVYIASCAQGSR